MSLRDHLVELTLGDVTVDRDQHRRALVGAVGDEIVKECANASDEAVRCALQASDESSANRCLGVKRDD